MTEPDFWRMFSEGRISFGPSGENIPAVKLYLSEVQAGVVPRTIWSHEEAGHTQDAKREVMALFPGDIPFGTPKPEKLIQNIIHIATNPGDLVLDSFLGSGTTAAVAHKMGRRWIGIEMGEHAATHCLPRLQKVIDGEQGGISKALNWTGGGGFRFMRLGATVFDESGRIHPAVRFCTLAAFVWQQETGAAFDPQAAAPGTPYLGTYYVFDSYPRTDDGREEAISFIKRPQFACYLLFNGILGDKRPASGNVLTLAVLDALLALHATTPEPSAPLLVYGEACRLGEERLKQARVTFKHIPYDVRAR
jgi:adenine-specific DNA-methyltransferase